MPNVRRTLNLLAVVLLVGSVDACAMAKKSPGWTSIEERKRQDLAWWPCSAADLIEAKLPPGTPRKGKWCSPYCPKEKADGYCAVERKMRVLDAMSDEDWAFIEHNDLMVIATKYVFN